MNEVQLGIAITTSAIGIGILSYIRFLKKKMKRYVLRNDKIEKYFKDKLE